MHFYVQQLNANKGSQRHEVILDVASMDDHTKLASLLGGQSQQADADIDRRASMLRFNYAPLGYQGFKEGSWYDVDPRIFGNAKYETINPDAEGASFLRANLTGLSDKYNFSQFLAEPRVAEVPTASLDLVVDPHPTDSINLTVVDCGHGNWNEINTTTDRLIYDVGACRSFTKARVRTMVAGRNIASETRPISVIISHWDIDHYHALLEFTPAELAKLRVVFTPSQVPDTETYKRVLKLLTKHGVVLAAQPPAVRPGSSREIVLVQHWQKGSFIMFRATPGRSRNQTGIVLGVQGPNGVALLTGDHHYNKVLDAAMQISAYGKRPCVLVTPHHGGQAGNLSVPNWLAFFSGLTTPISCGSNTYGHPIPTIQAQLRAMQAGVTPIRTDMHGTWTTAL